MNNEQTKELIRQGIRDLEIKLDKPWKELFSKCPATLYHYTDTKGLCGIINSGKIWATNIKYLNDASEITYAQTLVAETIKSLINSESDEAVQKFLRILLKNYIGEETVPHIYVACFCEEGNLLSQWRAYGAEGCGISLGIDSSVFLGVGSESREFILRPVIYDEVKQRALIEEEITNVITLLKDLISRGVVFGAHMIWIFSFLAARLHGLLFCFKHKAFETEKEWRFVSVELPIEEVELSTENTSSFLRERNIPVKFRTSAKMLIPYIELDITSKKKDYDGRIPIVTVVSGPAIHPLLGKESLRMFLISNGYDPDLFTMMETSNIPLRV